MRLLAGALILLTVEFHLANGGIFGFAGSLLELPAWECASFLVFVDDKAGSGNFEAQFFDGFPNRNALFEDQFDQKHAFLHKDSLTFIGIFE
jgi:hypothetical protein